MKTSTNPISGKCMPRKHAWSQIKDRTGRLIDGVFVKDA